MKAGATAEGGSTVATSPPAQLTRSVRRRSASTNEPLRILELRSVRGTGGGPEKTILLGGARADATRFAVTVCYLRDRRDNDFQIDRRAEALGLDYVEVLERHSFDPSIWTNLRALVRTRRIDIVHAHEYKTNLLAWLLARAEHIVPLSTVHGWFGRDTWRERLYYAADKRLLSRFPRVIAVSEGLKAELVRTGSHPDAVTVVPNGIDHRAFVRVPGQREEIRRALGIADDEVAIGAVGRLEHQKRFDLLMQTLAVLRSTHPRLRLFVVGEGGLKEELLAVHQRLRLGDACRFLGHRTDVPALHHAFDLFVQASDQEGSPNVVLEAMALETPIVATNVGGTAEILEADVHGVVVPPGSATALMRGIKYVLDDWPAARSRAESARRRVENELSFDVRMNRVENIYEELVDSAARSSP